MQISLQSSRHTSALTPARSGGSTFAGGRLLKSDQIAERQDNSCNETCGTIAARGLCCARRRRLRCHNANGGNLAHNANSRDFAREHWDNQDQREKRGHCKPSHNQASDLGMPNFLHRRQLKQNRTISCKAVLRRSSISLPRYNFLPSSKGIKL